MKFEQPELVSLEGLNEQEKLTEFMEDLSRLIE